MSMRDDKPFVLISNDDGVRAPGLAALAAAMARVGDTLVCAPEREQSAMGHSITVKRDLRVAEHVRDGRRWAYSVDGTPADCVKFALTELIRERGRMPDLVVSGINRGRNTGVNTIYSGTVAAAVEGMLYGLPAIAVSLDALRATPDIDFEPAGRCAESLVRFVLDKGLPEGVVLNLNVPHLPLERIGGAAVSRMSRSMFIDRFHRVHLENPREGAWVYRNLGEELVLDRAHEDNDDVILERGWVSVTPLWFDLNFHHYREELKDWAAGLPLGKALE